MAIDILNDVNGQIETPVEIVASLSNPTYKGEKGDQGPKGDAPVKGVDYWTEEDKQEIYDEVAQGAKGEDGFTFTPSVDSDGNLSWTNNGGLDNPTTVNIKGPKGD
jgi:hypothetical protein